MNRVSGDLYRVFEFSWFGRAFSWRVYQESWVVERPSVRWSRCSVGITGRVTYWKGVHPTTDVEIGIGWSGSRIGPANVTFRETSGATIAYSCDKESNAFRSVNLEIDVCQSVNNAPIVPTYNSQAHPDRPATTPQRTLTIEESYREAGVEIVVNPTRTVIDDSDPAFNRWSAAELHDAMEDHFSQIRRSWPAWNMWCVLAGTFDSPLTGGIMFDARAAFGGAGEAPERQGCAVFRDHSWFDDLVNGTPATDDQAAAMRQLLYTYVHEIGHAFNFLHSWDKSRPDSLSWMNYDWRYDNRNGANSFWRNFEFRFDDEELLHLRHGDRSAVIMGGDSWSSGGHLEHPGMQNAVMVGEAPIELMVRSKGYFHFLEPIAVEVRLRNRTDMPLDLNVQLSPEYGGVSVLIRKPDGRTVTYSPILCRLATPETKTLEATGTKKGADRHSERIPLTFGADGFYFDSPGTYQLRVVYQGAGNILLVSNVHSIRVGLPQAADDERLAQDYFTDTVGMSLYLDGSASKYLKNGMDVLQEVAERFLESPVGACISTMLARDLTRPFFSIRKNKLEKIRDADPDRALVHAQRAVAQYERDKTSLTTFDCRELYTSRAVAHAIAGAEDKADRSLGQMASLLKGRGVKSAVIESLPKKTKDLVDIADAVSFAP